MLPPARRNGNLRKDLLDSLSRMRDMISMQRRFRSQLKFKLVVAGFKSVKSYIIRPTSERRRGDRAEVSFRKTRWASVKNVGTTRTRVEVVHAWNYG